MSLHVNNHPEPDISDESVICIDSDSDSVISIKSCDSFPNQIHTSARYSDQEECYSSSEEEFDEPDLKGSEVVKRLYCAMESFVNYDLERNKKFWNSNIVRDLKTYLYFQDLRLRRFVNDIMRPDMIILNNIPKRLWGFVKEQCLLYGIHVQSRVNNQEEYLVLSRASNTFVPKGWRNRLDLVLFDYIDKLWGHFQGKKSNSIDFNPISSIGYQMLIKMGWQPGTPLGIRDGILEPIVLSNMRYSKSGLGVEDNF